MARRTLKVVEQEHNTPLDDLIPALLAQLGTQRAVADFIGLSQTTISTWLKENGYFARIIYVKGEPAHVPTD